MGDGAKWNCWDLTSLLVSHRVKILEVIVKQQHELALVLSKSPILDGKLKKKKLMVSVLLICSCHFLMINHSLLSCYLMMFISIKNILLKRACMSFLSTSCWVSSIYMLGGLNYKDMGNNIAAPLPRGHCLNFETRHLEKQIYLQGQPTLKIYVLSHPRDSHMAAV